MISSHFNASLDATKGSYLVKDESIIEKNKIQEQLFVMKFSPR